MVGPSALLPAGLALGAAGLLAPVSPKLKLGLVGAGAASLVVWWQARGAGVGTLKTTATTIGALAQSFAGLPAELAKMNEQGVGYALAPAGKIGQQILEQRELIADVERKIALDVASTGAPHPTKLALLERYKRNLATLEAQAKKG